VHPMLTDPRLAHLSLTSYAEPPKVLVSRLATHEVPTDGLAKSLGWVLHNGFMMRRPLAGNLFHGLDVIARGPATPRDAAGRYTVD
jgi:hypothetical protein